LYDLIPVDELNFRGTYVKDDVKKEGIGAPLVAVGRRTEAEAAAAFAPRAIYYSVTGVAEFEGSRCVLSIHDPLASETAQVEGRTYPLAANFTASLAMVLAEEKPQRLGLIRLLKPEEYANTARVSRMEPYNPDKAVVLVVHGLMDTPATWVPMLNQLRGDKDIRANYQFWFYSYPSGYPYPYSALILRHELDAIERKYPLRKKMVVIGHSMGGCITRTLISDPGTKLWVEAFGKSPEQTEMPEESKRLLKEALIFKPRSEIGRVIFLSAPHRGSDLAKNWIGRFGSMLVRTPIKMLTIGKTIREAATPDPAALHLKRFPNSVDTLAPNNRFVVAINKIPIAPGIPYHSIVGDRGRGDSPNSSDSVVAYWSSHLEGAASERIVPSNHSTPLNSEAIAEVNRILKLNVRSQ
jgi:pimeloyl-ACP methyl ester carboxylesterase